MTLALGPAGAAVAGDDRRCAALVSTSRPGLEIVSATLIQAGPFIPGGQAIRVPASCRVVGVARPTQNSEISFELWLPDGWTGRYAQLGNGGFAGNIDHPSLAAEIRRGNAAAMTDRTTCGLSSSAAQTGLGRARCSSTWSVPSKTKWVGTTTG